MRLTFICSALLLSLGVSACASTPRAPDLPGAQRLPVYPEKTVSQAALHDLSPPTRPVAVAVYGFTDQTGQFKPTETGQTLSRAVSQGGASILVKALQDAGKRQWFTIVEREQLKNLLQERQIIREMRERYLGEQQINREALPALLFAGVLLEGGVIGYDTNTLTGGLGARFLGIGGNVEYRQDTVTVYLRAVSVRTGEVLTSVTASKTIASHGVGANAFRYVAFKELLEAEAGFSTNEPDQVALQQAVEKAVYALVMEGVELKLWSFQDVGAGWPQYVRYAQERDGAINAAQAQRLMEEERRTRPARQAAAPRQKRAAQKAPAGALTPAQLQAAAGAAAGS